jgi:hypothetical protein
MNFSMIFSRKIEAENKYFLTHSEVNITLIPKLNNGIIRKENYR